MARKIEREDKREREGERGRMSVCSEREGGGGSYPERVSEVERLSRGERDTHAHNGERERELGGEAVCLCISRGRVRQKD